MANKYEVVDKVKFCGIEIPAGSSALEISNDVGIQGLSIIHFIAMIKASSVALAPDEKITVRLQQWNTVDWLDVPLPQGGVDITADGTFCIALSAGVEVDSLVLPLLPKIRLVADSGPGSSAKIDNILVARHV